MSSVTDHLDGLYDVIDPDGQVMNLVRWDGESEYHPGEGLTLRPHELLQEEAPDAAPAPVPVLVDPAALDTLAARAAKATTVAGVRSAFVDLIAALTPQE